MSGCEAHGLGDGVGGFEGGDDALRAGEGDGGFEGVVIRAGDVGGAAGVVEHGVLGADGGVVEAGGDAVGARDLAGVVLEDVAVGSLEDAGEASADGLEAGGVLAEGGAAASGFDADEADVLVFEELVEGSDGVGAAADAAATIAHEIHNPLDSVSNLLFLMDGESTPEESSQFLQLAKGEIARVTQISRAMLSLYREAKAPIEIDLSEMLQSILLLMERRFNSLGITVETDFREGVVIHGFPAELRQVFTNLLTNAAEASAPDDVITVSAVPCEAHIDAQAGRREKGAIVTIRDHGRGVPEEIQAQLFQPFFTTKGERGTGLGLWISRGIMTRHGGTIDLSSNSDPILHGTTVSVFLATDPAIQVVGE